MKPNIPRVFRRVAVLLPALSLLLAPLASNARDREKEMSEAFGPNQENIEVPELGTTGRAGAIDEFNLGPTGTDIGQQREDQDEGNTRLLSGRVVGIEGRTLYVERSGVVVPLNMSALRIKKQPKMGQQVIAEYQVDQAQNVCLSLSGEVAPSAD
ncbi:MAG TPA: hypothetical protein VNA24_08380 [Hyalangium sp.]|nr:hypothetical protein [Hyalangium sp.]